MKQNSDLTLEDFKELYPIGAKIITANGAEAVVDGEPFLSEKKHYSEEVYVNSLDGIVVLYQKETDNLAKLHVDGNCYADARFLRSDVFSKETFSRDKVEPKVGDVLPNGATILSVGKISDDCFVVDTAHVRKEKDCKVNPCEPDQQGNLYHLLSKLSLVPCGAYEAYQKEYPALFKGLSVEEELGNKIIDKDYMFMQNVSGIDYGVPTKAMHDVKVVDKEFMKGCSTDGVKKSREFASGSRRDNADEKPLVMDMSPYALMRYGYWMALNALNYGKGNWELGQPTKDVFESLARHVTYYKMSLNDPELFKVLDDGSDHLSAILFNTQMLLQNEGRDGINPKKYFDELKEVTLERKFQRENTKG